MLVSSVGDILFGLDESGFSGLDIIDFLLILHLSNLTFASLAELSFTAFLAPTGIALTLYAEYPVNEIAQADHHEQGASKAQLPLPALSQHSTGS